MDINKINIEASIEISIKRDVEILLSSFIKSDISYHHKVILSTYNHKYKYLHYAFIIVFFMEVDYIFIVKGGEIPYGQYELYPNERVDNTPEYFEMYRNPTRINIETVLDFIEQHPCNNPILLIDCLNLETPYVLESLNRLSNFKRASISEYVSFAYNTFVIPKEESLVQLYELNNERNKGE